MPWKNGQGVTLEIAIEPAGASLTQFDWRLSMARIDADGTFSKFSNIDRLLMVLEGRLQLDIEAPDSVELAPFQYLAFPGEASVSCRLSSPDPVLDFNVMVHRQRYAARMRSLTIRRNGSIEPTAAVTAVLCRTAGTQVSCESQVFTLQPDDVLLVEQGAESIGVSNNTSATLCIAEIVRLTSTESPAGLK
jgi:environmental stress-induced protein Ves